MTIVALYQTPLDAVELEPHRSQFAHHSVPPHCPASMDLPEMDTPLQKPHCVSKTHEKKIIGFYQMVA